MAHPTGPADPPGERPHDVRQAAGLVAAVGAAAAAATVLAFYAPGMLASGSGIAELVFLLALPTIAMALPFALLAFVRVRLVLLLATAMLAFTLGSGAWDLFTGPPDGKGESLIVFALLIVVNVTNAVIALSISAGIAAARRL